MTYQTLILYSKRKSSITAPAPLTTKLIFKQARFTLLRAFLFFLKYGLNFVSRLNVFCFNLLILQWSFAKRFDKKLGNSPGLANTRPLGSAKFANALPQGRKCGQMPRGSPGGTGRSWNRLMHYNFGKTQVPLG